MMNSIGLYIQQRFKTKVYLPLSILLSLLSVQEYETCFTAFDRVFSLMIITSLSLLFFRIIDDLISRKDDEELPNRIYTKQENVVPLVVFSIAVLIGVSFFVFKVFEDHFYSYLYMIGLSLIPYVFRLVLPQLNFIYPLFKYGLIVFFMSSVHGELTHFDFVFAGIVVFSFVQHEILEDNRLLSFRKHIQWMYWCLVIPFLILFPTACIWILSSSILLYGFWRIKKPNYMHYCILLLILSLKIIVYVV